MRRVKNIMGIPISIDIPELTDEKLFEMVFTRLQQIDTTFSTYKPDSMLNQFLDGKKALSSEMQQVKNACAAYEHLTGGYFSAHYNGSFDPTGYVKGWAIQEARDTLKASHVTTFLINAAGDIMAASDGKKLWNISLQDPFSRTATLGTVTLKNGAIATSGTYERGRHIFNPHTKQPVGQLVSASVYGPEIIPADVFATACIAMGGERAIDFINDQPGYEALFVAADGTVFTSKNIGH
jgi:thiamine biosynthesis lipoprotein